MTERAFFLFLEWCEHAQSNSSGWQSVNLNERSSLLSYALSSGDSCWGFGSEFVNRMSGYGISAATCTDRQATWKVKSPFDIYLLTGSFCLKVFFCVKALTCLGYMLPNPYSFLPFWCVPFHYFCEVYSQYYH